MNNREVMVIHSMHIRNILEGMDEEFKYLGAVIGIQQRCYRGEQKFKKVQTARYKELILMCNSTMRTYSRLHGKQKIASDTFITVLHSEAEHEFTHYFGLKEKLFGNLYKLFGEEDDLEGHTMNLAYSLTDIIKKELELESWKKWVKTNQRNYNVL